MGRNRGKFSFPIPGRRSQKKTEKDDDTSSIPSIASTHERPSRLEEPSSKAHRVLGTSGPFYRSSSKQSFPVSPGYMSVTVSEASFGSETDNKSSRTAMDYNGAQAMPGISRRPSSNIMGRAYSGDGRRGSDLSTASHRLQPQTSNSTMRSHYDPKSSPLSISQQTSNSAVRDMALRRGKPQVVTDYNSNGYLASPISPVILNEAKRKENRKSKPARLDLSKLFPKPSGGNGQDCSNALLSPTKMVNSPAAMSMTSDCFPRPMTREPTPNPRSQVKLKTTSRQYAAAPCTSSSPARKFKRDEYDNAKIHVRRPPKGVEHWFDALDEDSDETLEKVPVPIHAPKAVRPNAIPKVPIRQTSSSRPLLKASNPRKASRAQHLAMPMNDTFTHEDLVDVIRLNSPSQFSLVSTKTRESTLSKTNLQDSSVLSFSSSEDEQFDPCVKPSRVAVRKSLDTDYAGEIVIGQAHALEVRQHRRPSAAQMSTLSTSTSAATIEVMYTPEPPLSPLHYPRNSNYSGGRRSNHMRQPSIIPEDEDIRPKTAVNTPVSPTAYSIVSARTSTSEPKPRTNGEHKLMAVTAEEEALLELMRKKRASMAKKGVAQASKNTEEQDKRQMTPVEGSRKPYRTSGFLAEASPVRTAESNPARKISAVSPSPLLLPPRGRPRKTHHEATVGHSHLRDSSVSDAWSERHSSPASRASLPHHLATPSEFSPIDLFPPASPTQTADVASPTTTDHLSPPPSPITPGLRAFEADVNVKVASSDTSNDNDDVTVLETGVIGAPSESIKSSNSSHGVSAHRRRRTASSGADASFPLPPTSGLTDLTPLSEGSSSPPSIIEPLMPKLPRRSSRRVSGLVLSTNGHSRSRQSSVHSSNSQLSLHSHSSGLVSAVEKRASRRVSRQSSAASICGTLKGKRNSVSDDVLAAWNSLGGTY